MRSRGPEDPAGGEAIRPIPPELLRQIRRLEIRTRRRVRELFGGEYHSAFKGKGMEFREVRAYSWGDDVRAIDWNVTARTGSPHLKLFEEERELTVLLVVDLSASGRFASVTRSRRESMAELGAMVLFSALRNQDKVGQLLFSDQVEQILPPRKGKRHALRLIRELLWYQPEGERTDLAGVLEELVWVQKRRAVVFVLSDFIAPPFERALRLAARRHDLVCVQFRDPNEIRLPDAGLLALRDLEDGSEHLLDSGDASVRAAWEALAAKKQKELRKLISRAGADHMEIELGGDLEPPLREFFLKREKRR